MRNADFVHLVRRWEHASAADQLSYRRSVAWFAVLAYAWVLGLLGLGGTVVVWAGEVLWQGHFDVATFVGLGAGLALLASGLRALRCRLGRPAGLRLAPTEAPALFAALERIRRKVDGPALDDVLLGPELDAVITQRARWGVLGGARYDLVIGLPLLMALDRDRLLAVLAHEYGHLRRTHGRFAAWVYRTRVRWSRLAECVAGRGEPAALKQGFLGWYFPRFVARSFPLARQDEYEADRISARLLGGEVTAAAMTEVALKNEWLRAQFWPGLWALAAEQVLPVGPYQQMRKQLRLPLPPTFARLALAHVLRRTSSLDDTHPALRERLAGLGQEPRVPAWTQQPAIDLLGPRVERWIAHFDQQWCRERAGAWKQHNAALRRTRQRVEQLQAQPRRSADEWTELGHLQRRLAAPAQALSSYQQALALAPRHGGALQGLCACLSPEQAQQRLASLERLHEASADHRWWAAQEAVAALEAQPGVDPALLERWQERLAQAEEAEARGWAELSRQPFLDGTAPEDLSDFERRELEAELARWPDVRCAWLLRRPLREFPNRRSYVLVVELPRHDRDKALALCGALEPCLWLPGPVLLLWSGEAPELAQVGRHTRPLYDVRVLV